MFATTKAFAPAAAPQSNALGQIKQMIAVHKQRKALATMEASQLLDLGLTDDMVAAEIARPFWDF